MNILPWHKLCAIRDDVKGGSLTLDEFAADLNAVRTGEAAEVYKDPGLFFARTYPTYKMKTLARDVFQRLAGQGGKPSAESLRSWPGG
jgi:predicted AAA+ superfamily ATPase